MRTFCSSSDVVNVKLYIILMCKLPETSSSFVPIYTLFLKISPSELFSFFIEVYVVV